MAIRKRSDKFPLWLQHEGLWCKTIRGRCFYFDKDKDAASSEYVRVKDDLLAGHKPREKVATGKQARLDTGMCSNPQRITRPRDCSDRAIHPNVLGTPLANVFVKFVVPGILSVGMRRVVLLGILVGILGCGNGEADSKRSAEGREFPNRHRSLAQINLPDSVERQTRILTALSDQKVREDDVIILAAEVESTTGFGRASSGKGVEAESDRKPVTKVYYVEAQAMKGGVVYRWILATDKEGDVLSYSDSASTNWRDDIPNVITKK